MSPIKTLSTRGLVAVAISLWFLSTSFSHTKTGSQSPANDNPPKIELTIKDIMDQAHKKGLVKKVATGKATVAETKNLHELYTKLAKLKPPKGDQKSWDDKTKALVDAAKAAVDKDPNFKTKLKKASTCATCHKLHK